MYGKMRRVRRIFGLNEIYLSTGAILGRRNGFDFRVLTEHYNAFHCDGFEFMMFRDSYDSYARIPEWLRACRSRGIRIAAFHADKHIGDLLSDPDELSLSAVKAALLRGAKQVEGRRGRAMCVARSQKTKREKTNAGVKRRVNGMLFTVKCALQDFTTREDGWHVMDR